jgi:hypothetical protein
MDKQCEDCFLARLHLISVVKITQACHHLGDKEPAASVLIPMTRGVSPQSKRSAQCLTTKGARTHWLKCFRTCAAAGAHEFRLTTFHPHPNDHLKLFSNKLSHPYLSSDKPNNMSFFRVVPPLFKVDSPPPGLPGNHISGAAFYHCTTNRCYTVWGIVWGNIQITTTWDTLAEY